MIIERFKNGDPTPVYDRFREQGRLAPDGLVYIASWVDTELRICFQVMEADARALLDEWIARWSDIVEFDVYEVVTSADAAALMVARADNRV